TGPSSVAIYAFPYTTLFRSTEFRSGSPAASMDQRSDAKRKFWIRSQDSLGNAIDSRLIEAADRVWERARLVVIRYLTEDTEAPRSEEHTSELQSRENVVCRL